LSARYFSRSYTVSIVVHVAQRPALHRQPPRPQLIGPTHAFGQAKPAHEGMRNEVHDSGEQHALGWQLASVRQVPVPGAIRVGAGAGVGGAGGDEDADGASALADGGGGVASVDEALDGGATGVGCGAGVVADDAAASGGGASGGALSHAKATTATQIARWRGRRR
jgi:hypothetical protein